MEVKIEGIRLKKTYVASAIAYSDFVISIARVKGNGVAGLATSLKNIGIGCLSRAGKSRIHFSTGPRVDSSKCNGCGICLRYCKREAIRIMDGKVFIDESLCNRCLICTAVYPNDAITAERIGPPETQYRIADSALAVMRVVGRDRFAFMNIACEITPQCDCGRRVDAPIAPDQGIFVSRDPVAVNRAVADKIVEAPGLPGTAAEEFDTLAPGSDKIVKVRGTNWRVLLDVAEKLCVGTQRYELIGSYIGL